MKIKSASDLKRAVVLSGKEPHFFTRSNMKFFGDTMRNYGIRQPRQVETISGPVMAYELKRKTPAKNGLSDSAFFNAKTFSRVFTA